MTHGTYSNGPALPPITMADLMETKRKLDALGPPPPSDVTVSPDILDHVRDALAPTSGVRVAAPHTPRLGGLALHVDERLPPGTWHPGRPL